ncbi:MAG: molybdopterin-dependent oxidoreductase [Chthoniobacter sp.]|nr:molybdopterin-dependent oxidoreductase [Chthoniobacter sp.]
MNKPTISQATAVDRRKFLKVTGGFLLALTLPVATNRALADTSIPANATGTAFIRIGADESITVLVGGGEMGQGIYTGLAMGAAEELMVTWEKVKVEPLPAIASWLSAGSGGIRSRLPTFLKAGAAAREMLVSAAAQTWGVPVASCQAVNGTVKNLVTNEVLTYGQLAPLAATLPVPAAPVLTPAANYRIIGTPAARPDLVGKVNGSAKYGLDAVVPGMALGIVKHAPVMGGTLKTTPSVPSGASAVVPLGATATNPVNNAIALVSWLPGANTWGLMETMKSISSNIWNTPANAALLDSNVFKSQAMSLLGRGAPFIAEQKGNVDTAFASAARVLEMTYTLPYLPHACMEVLNCTVRMTPATAPFTACEIWAPTQAPSSVLTTVSAVTGLPKTAITVYPMFMGGGLGRKFEQDYITQAITTAMAVGRPVKLVWPRSEDMTRDQYRPMAVTRIRVALDAAGNITGWQNRHVSPSISAQRRTTPLTAHDANATEGATALPYNLPNRLIDYVQHMSPIPVGYWRSVGYSINCFAVESAIDEVALATGADPLTLRRQLLSTSTDPLAARTLAVVNAAAAAAGWETTAVPAGRARGIAVGQAFGTIVAEVAEIGVTYTGGVPTNFTVYKVACAVDCGTAVNPNSVEAQMQGGIFHGLSAAKWGELKWTAGKSSVTNFNKYRMTRLSEAPVITTTIVNSGAAMSGCGEPGVPPIAPAVANAYAKLTGVRVRDLPFFPGATMGG